MELGTKVRVRESADTTRRGWVGKVSVSDETPIFRVTFADGSSRWLEASDVEPCVVGAYGTFHTSGRHADDLLTASGIAQYLREVGTNVVHLKGGPDLLPGVGAQVWAFYRDSGRRIGFETVEDALRATVGYP